MAIDYSYAAGDKKCNLRGAGDRQGAHWMLVSLFLDDKFDLSSERLSKLLDELWEESGITAHGFKLIEDLLAEAIRLRDMQTIKAIKALPKGT